jgi:hypothetical protein
MGVQDVPFGRYHEVRPYKGCVPGTVEQMIFLLLLHCLFDVCAMFCIMLLITAQAHSLGDLNIVFHMAKTWYKSRAALVYF